MPYLNTPSLTHIHWFPTIKPQIARPISDISNSGNWLDTTWGNKDTILYNELDEITVDYLDSAIHHQTPIIASDTFEVGVSTLLQPISKENHKITFYASGPPGTFIKALLYQGTTLIATSSDFALNPTINTYQYKLTTAEANSISSYTNLRVRIIPS